VRIIIESENETTYLLAADDLPDLSESRLLSSMSDAGYPVADVRKVLHEGRGRLLVEFYLPVSMEEAKKATKSSSRPGDTPVMGRYYKLTKTLVFRTVTNTPLTLRDGIILRMDGPLPTEDQFHVTNGPSKDISVRMSSAEWMQNALSMIDLGDDLGKAGNGPAVVDDVEANSLGGAPSDKPAPGLTPKVKGSRKKPGFPEWPSRKPLSSYMSKKK
jgi:hypothetical protein